MPDIYFDLVNLFKDKKFYKHIFNERSNGALGLSWFLIAVPAKYLNLSEA
jgi:hypothetical protein